MLLLCAVAFGSGAATAAAEDVQLVWDPNTEPDLAGYVVLIGTAPRVYTQSVEVGPAQPFASINGLPGGLTYYFAVRAFNTAGLQSGLSNEVSVFVASTSAPAGPAPVVTKATPSSGPAGGGTLVALSVTGLKPGATVTFGGQEAVVVSSTSSSLVVVAPAHSSGKAPIVVRNSDGGTSNGSVSFTYQAGDPPAWDFVRYFAEGVQSSFFQTRFALANPHDHAVAVRVTFTDVFGTETVLARTLPAGARMTLDRSNLPPLASDAFGSRFEASHPIGIDRTVTWDAAQGYGSHSETGIVEPRTTWYLAEGATHSGFNLFYLLQNSTQKAAQVRVRYLLATGGVIEKHHVVAPRARTNIWVNLDDPALASAEMSAHIESTNGVPIVVERSMYLDHGGQLFTAGHNSGALPAASTRWFLAEGSTGDYFDTFILVANPNSAPAQLRVTYLRAGDRPVEVPYTVAPNSRLTIWVDQQPGLSHADVSAIVESVNDQPVIVERSMWWPGVAGGPWTEAHNSAAVTTTASRWVVADGEDSPATTTYVLVANTGDEDARVRFTLLGPSGKVNKVTLTVKAQQRFSMDVGATFAEARNTRFGVLVEAEDPDAPLVVERATYSDAQGIPWAAGSNSLGTPLD